MAVFPFNLKCSAVIVMVVALLAAVVFALGHDAFYRSLDGKSVLNAQPLNVLSSSFNLSNQQVYISLGTFFAFIVKSFLGVSVSTVFDQLVWKSIHGQRTQIGMVDDLLSALKNGFTVLNLQLWKRFPISMTLAIICWLLPIASMISPATLSVHLTPFNEYTFKRVPLVDFTSTNFASLGTIIVPSSTGQSYWITGYNGPTPETRRVVNSVATQGEILPIEAPAVNSSWSVEFYGPTIACDHVNQTLADYISQNVAQAINGSKMITEAGTQKLRIYDYLSWVPESDAPLDSTPFHRVQGNGSDTYTQRLVRLGPLLKDPENPFAGAMTPAKPSIDGPPLSLFVAIFPHALEYTEYDKAVENVDRTVQESTILRCSLHNASYQADLIYVNRNQTIHVTDRAVLNGVSAVEGISNIDFDKGTISSNISFIHNPQLMERLSYQAIMEAFGGLLIGSISTQIAVVVNKKDGHTTSISNTGNPNTTIASTTLMDTEEMKFVRSIIGLGPKSPFVDYWNARSVSSSIGSSLLLSKALEELFQNITFSLMSSKMFQPNYTAKAIPETNVTITSYHNIYVYSQSILWAAYGSAISVTTLSVAAGILLYFSNDGSYSTKFSTIFRVTQGAVISTDLRMRDCSGLEPLPNHIANAKMTTGLNDNYELENPARGSSRAPLGHRHRDSAISSQLLETTSDEVVHNDNDKRSNTTVW